MSYSVRTLLVVTAIGSAFSAQADSFPSRKPGLWEMTVREQGTSEAHTVKQCTDAKTDEKMMKAGSELGGAGQKKCAKNEFHKTSSGYESEAECTYVGSTMVSKGVYIGDFATSYSGVITTTFRPALFGKEGSKTEVSAKYLGACSGDMKPGDMVMNGMKINVDTVAAEAKQAAAMMDDPKFAEAMQNAAKMMGKGKGGIDPARLEAMQKSMQGMMDQ
jgi:hypothetical protein